MKIVWNNDLSPPGQDFISLRKAREVFERVAAPARDTVVLADGALMQDLERAHDPQFVHNVMMGRLMNGYGNTDPAVLKHVLAANGVMIRAVQEALGDGRGAAPVMAPVNGFHHAHYDNCYGYCTFNGLIVAPLVAGLRGKKVLIIDGDGHDGDGTKQIIKRLRLGDTFTNVSGDQMREKWAVIIPYVMKQRDWDLIIYQAGADAHQDDPYGAGYLDDMSFAARDELVFALANDRKIPLVWNLAGGYAGEATIQLHAGTARRARVIDNAVRAAQRLRDTAANAILQTLE